MSQVHINPLLFATFADSRRVGICNLARIFCTCVLTVFRLIVRGSAISLLVAPYATCNKICCSARVQAVRDIQNKRFLNNTSSDIVCNADMRVGEIRQFCRLQEEGQSLMRAAMT